MAKSALVIGGTGPTGPHIIEGLLRRGYETTILHRGLHEPSEIADVEHIHADPHFIETLDAALGDRHWDLMLGMYGRISAVAEAAVGRCDRLVCVGGVPVYRGLTDSQSMPHGMPLLARESSPLVDELEAPPRFAARIREAELAVLGRGAAGAYECAGVRYSQIYGPRNPIPWEWGVVGRILDGRHEIILPDNGLWIISRCAALNAAELVLKLIDTPTISNGKYYNAADDDQFTLGQLVELIADTMGAQVDLVGIPAELAPNAFREFLPPGGQPHLLVDNRLARDELGYAELVPARAALTETVRWLVDNPVTVEDYPAYTVPFDYRREDNLIEVYRRACAWTTEQAPEARSDLIHAMPHPRRPSLTGDELGR